MLEENSIYFNSIQGEHQKTLENLTQSKNWDSAQFNKIIVTLGLIGNGQSIPARFRPESINLQVYRKYFEDLLERTKKEEKEHARAIFIDREKQSVIISGVSVGIEGNSCIDDSPQPGREKFQSLIGSIHSHTMDITAHSFSDGDLGVFLSDKRQQFMIMVYGESMRLIVLKTSVTPNNMSIESLKRRISEATKDSFSTGKVVMEQVVDFDKIICAEFGLVFYMATKSSDDFFKKINVVD